MPTKPTPQHDADEAHAQPSTMVSACTARLETASVQRGGARVLEEVELRVDAPQLRVDAEKPSLRGTDQLADYTSRMTT